MGADVVRGGSVNEWWVRFIGKEVPTVRSSSELGCSYPPIRVPKPHLRIPKSVFCKVHTS